MLDWFEAELLAEHKAPWVYVVGMIAALTAWAWVPLGILYCCYRFALGKD